jgi:hypothetical protein
MTSKAIIDVKPGDQTERGITYISEPDEQPDGSVSIRIRYPSGRRELLDFDGPDADSEVPVSQ